MLRTADFERHKVCATPLRPAGDRGGQSVLFICQLENWRYCEDSGWVFMEMEYDFSKGERGKFYRPDAELSIPIYLEPDVAKVFRSSAAMSQALRSLLRVSATTRRLTKPSERRAGSARR